MSEVIQVRTEKVRGKHLVLEKVIDTEAVQRLERPPSIEELEECFTTYSVKLVRLRSGKVLKEETLLAGCNRDTGDGYFSGFKAGVSYVISETVRGR